MKIVQFENGKYAVQVSAPPIPIYIDKDGVEWGALSTVQKYCLFDTVEEARAIRNQYNFKVFKVIEE